MRISLLFLFAFAAFGQSYVPPDCQFTLVTSTATPGAAQNNKSTAISGLPCTYWVFSYWTNGASGVSVKLEGSADVAGVSSGSYTALTASQGSSNPQTGTTQGAAELCCDYYPWIRVNPTTFSGSSQTMIARVYGWRGTPVAPGGGAVSANVNVGQFGGASAVTGTGAGGAGIPRVTISNDSSLAANQSVNQAQFGGSSVSPCLSQILFNLSGSGDTQIIAASGSTTIRICHVSFSSVGSEDIKLTRGTGSNCGTGTADLTGLYKSVQAMALDWGPYSPLTGAASGAVCLNQSVAQALGGIVIYDQR